MEEKIDLKEYLQIFKKRVWMILLITTVAIVIAGVKTFFFTTPIYQAHTTVMINNRSGKNVQVTQSDIDYSKMIGETYRPIIKSRKVAQQIKENLELDMSYKSISDSIEMTSVSGPVMSVTVTGSNPSITQKIANEVPNVFRKELKRITKVDGVEVIDKALKPSHPISPNKMKNLLMATIIGIVISIFIVFLLEYLDNKVKTPIELEKALDLSLLGVIPNEGNKEKHRNIDDVLSFSDPKSQISEAYRNTRTNIQFSNLDKQLEVISITSSKQNEGKSTIVSNLGVSFASLENKKVLILDCDLRNPSIHRIYGLSNAVGLTDVLIGSKLFNQCVQNTKVENLDILTTGHMPPNPAEMLNSNKMKNFVNEIRGKYDYVFIDTPPIGVVTDAGIVSTYSDAIVMITASNEVEEELLKTSKERLQKVNANIIGCILNKFDPKKHSGYEYYGYYYGDQGSRKRKKQKHKQKSLA